MSVGRHCIIYRVTLPFTATIKGLCYARATQGKLSVRKYKKLMLRGKKMKNTGSVKESAGAVKDSKRGYFRGVRESKYKKKDLTGRLLDWC